VLAIVCPGQGAQTPGLLQPWIDIPECAGHLGRLAEAAGVDLLRHGTVSDAETIRDTAVAQPLIVASGLVALRALFPAPSGVPTAADPLSVAATAGHSVGEITATVAAGVLSDEAAMGLVGVRGRAMAAAAEITATGMTAVLGGDRDEVATVLDRHGLTMANVNGAGQVVAAGTLEQLAALAADPPAKARIIPLQVAGAFHTHHMAPAVDALGHHAAGLTAGAPAVRLLSNADGAIVIDGADVVKRLVVQVSNPVRWDLCMATLLDLGITGLIELPPAGTLANLAKRGMRGVETLAVRTPEDLAAAREMISRHAPTGGTTTGGPA
jgi:[acyl-carrier-protein] S-malonyltransferase